MKAKVKSREEIIQWFKDRSGVQDDDGDWVCNYRDGSLVIEVYCSEEMLDLSFIDVEPVSDNLWSHSCSDWYWHKDWIEILDAENEDRLEEEAYKGEQMFDFNVKDSVQDIAILTHMEMNPSAYHPEAVEKLRSKLETQELLLQNVLGLSIDEANQIRKRAENLLKESDKGEQKKGYYEAKFDEGKPYQLMPYQAVREILNKTSLNPWAKQFRDTMVDHGLTASDAFDGVNNVLEYGLKKYGKKDSWKFVPDAQQRYCAAYLRHTINLDKYHIDEESGIKSVYHALCNLMFLIWFEEMED